MPCMFVAVRLKGVLLGFAACVFFAAMTLRVWSASGEELAALPAEAVSDVRSLKDHLQSARGLPRFAQRLLHEGTILRDEGVCPTTDTDVQLIMIPFVGLEESEKCRMRQFARNGNEARLEELLQRPVDPNTADAHGTTCLHDASSLGLVQIVRFLLSAGAGTDIVDESGRTALHHALQVVSRARFREPHPDVVRLLLQARAGVNVADLAGRTSLHAGVGFPDIFRMILDARADGNLADANGWSALHFATLQNRVAVAQLLLEGGWEKDAIDYRRMTALHVASRTNRAEIADSLLRAGYARDLADCDGRTALHLACTSEGSYCSSFFWGSFHWILVDHPKPLTLNPKQGTTLGELRYERRCDDRATTAGCGCRGRRRGQDGESLGDEMNPERVHGSYYLSRI